MSQVVQLRPGLSEESEVEEERRQEEPSSKEHLLGRLMARLSPDDLHGSLSATLDILRGACGADAADLFLSEPGSNNLILTALSGAYCHELATVERFGLGVGYPGIVAMRGEPMVSRDLSADGQFLRQPLAARGVRSYACVAIPGPRGPLGTVGLVWCDGDAPIEAALSVLKDSTGAISMLVRAALAGIRDSADFTLGEAASAATAIQRSVLEMMIHSAGAMDGALVLGRDFAGSDVIVVGPAGPRTQSADAVLASCALSCSTLRQGHGVSLGDDRERWPSVCRKTLPDAMSSPACLPLCTGTHLRGAVLLDYGPELPTPATRDLVPLMTMAREAVARLSSDGGKVTSQNEAKVPLLSIRCLGKFEIFLGAREIRPGLFPRKKALELLKLLVMNAGRKLSRDVLIEHLWPGVAGKAGVNRLHGVVHALRSVIEPFRERREWLYIRNDGELYYFDTDAPHQIDIYKFREHRSAARELSRRGVAVAATDRLEQAIALYRGDLFADDPYADWCAAQRDEIRRSYLDAINEISEMHVAAGELEQAVEHLRLGLLEDPLREDLHQKLIAALADLDRRGEALEQYEDCVRLLQEELGAAPLAETRKLGELVRRSLMAR